jgi:hypothetical protein
MDFEAWKQRREEMIHEVGQSRLAKGLRASRERCGSGRASASLWELRRAAGRLLKLFRTLRKPDYERREPRLSKKTALPTEDALTPAPGAPREA